MGPAGGAPPITDALRGEHGALYALFDAVSEMLATGPPAAGGLAGLLGALLAPVLASHASLEDGILLAGFTGSEPGPLVAMEEEHRGIEARLERLVRERDESRARELLEELLQAARDHFEREEVAVFPFAEAHMEAEDLSRLGETWAARRGVGIG
jgi:hypothetical protein